MSEEQPKDPAFVIADMDREAGTVTLIVKMGILGPVSNQLKNTKDYRKGCRIVRKLGFVLSSVGDYLYGKTDEVPDMSAGFDGE